MAEARRRVTAQLGAILVLWFAIGTASAANDAVAQVFADVTSGVQPGCSVAVSKDGVVLHAAGYGYARYHVRLEQGQLIVDDGRVASALLPMGPQEFQASKTLRVLRFANGEPAMEFSLFAGGARDLRFKRVDAQEN